MKDSLLSACAVDSLIEELVRNAGFRIRHSVRSSFEEPNLRVIFEGPDSSLLSQNGGVLLEAIQCFVSDALGLNEEESHRIAFNLGYDEADLCWEFQRSAEFSHQPEPTMQAQRSNASCVSEELWDRLVHHSHGEVLHSLN